MVPLDRLRLYALLGVFVFHALHPFDEFEWHVKNADQSGILSALAIFVLPWGLGLFFCVSGAASTYALRSGGTIDYALRRVRRLLVPYVAGMLTLSPLQAYVEETHAGSWDAGLAAFVPEFFGRLWTALVHPRPEPLPVGWNYHLWFLLFLLWFSLLCIPLFGWMRGAGATRVTALGDRLVGLPGGALWLGAPIALLHVGLRAAFPDEHSWGEFAYYLGFFAAGFFIVSRPAVLDSVRRNAGMAAALGVVGFGALVALDPVEWAEEWARNPEYTPRYFLMFGIFSVQGWAWCAAVMGAALRLPRFVTPVPRKVASAAFPFFLVHQPVVLVVAAIVIDRSWPMPVKALAVVTVSFAASVAAACGMVIAGTRFANARASHRRGDAATPARAGTLPATVAPAPVSANLE